jgi:hypothetical protein
MQTLGITPQDLQEALPLPQIWLSLLDALMGKYIVCYDLKRIRILLEKSSEMYELDPLPVVGDCLLRYCLRYFQSAGFVGLVSLCDLVGHPLPEPPDQTAFDRAIGQLRLLEAMSQGVSGVRPLLAAHDVQNADVEDDLDEGLC